MSEPVVLRRSRGQALAVTAIIGGLGLAFSALLVFVLVMRVPLLNSLLVTFLFVAAGPGLLLLAFLSTAMLRQGERALFAVSEAGVTLARALPYWRLGPDVTLAWGEIERITLRSSAFAGQSLEVVSVSGPKLRVAGGAHDLPLRAVFQGVTARLDAAGVPYDVARTMSFMGRHVHLELAGAT